MEDGEELKRSFPAAADGTPTTAEEVILFGAGCDPETARFVARQLEQQGIALLPADILSRAVRAMEGVTVFVTSRERINRPTGEDWWQDQISALKSVLSHTS